LIDAQQAATKAATEATDIASMQTKASSIKAKKKKEVPVEEDDGVPYTALVPEKW